MGIKNSDLPALYVKAILSREILLSFTIKEYCSIKMSLGFANHCLST